MQQASNIAQVKWESPGSVTPGPSLLLVQPGTQNSDGVAMNTPADFDVAVDSVYYYVIDGSHRFMSTKLLVEQHFDDDWDKLLASRHYLQYYYTPCEIMVGVPPEQARMVRVMYWF
jgi:hypothetical protein